MTRFTKEEITYLKHDILWILEPTEIWDEEDQRYYKYPNKCITFTQQEFFETLLEKLLKEEEELS